MKWSTCLSVMAGVVLMVLGTGAWATDLDEQYRPLLDKGQVLWDLDEPYTNRSWHDHSVFSLNSRLYINDWFYSQSQLWPVTALKLGLTDRVQAIVSGSFSQWRTPYSNVPYQRDWSGTAGLVFRQSKGLQFSLSYAHSSNRQWADDANMFWSETYTSSSDLVRAQMEWLSRPKRSYDMLVPDLNGLFRPILDPRQIGLTARIDTERGTWDQHYSYPSGRNHSHATRPNHWTFALDWRMGLAPGWEAGVGATYTPDYSSRSWSDQFVQPGVPNNSITRNLRMWNAWAAVRRRWGQLRELAFTLRRETYSFEYAGFHVNAPLTESHGHSYTMWAAAEWSVLSRPKGQGNPLGHDLAAYQGPLLERGQLAWTGALSWARSRSGWSASLPVSAGGSGGLSRPYWALRTGLTCGVTPTLQLRGDLTLTPYFNGSGYSDEWRHGTVGVSVVSAPNPKFRFRASYTYGLDDSGGHSLYSNYYGSERHTISVGFSALW